MIIILLFTIFSLAVFLKGLHQSISRHQVFTETPFLFWMGVFVWGDAITIGLFWTLASAFCYLIGDWILFSLIFSVFWFIRSLGETSYWVHEQFSPQKRNLLTNLRGFRFVKNDSIHFIYQTFYQCLSVIALVSVIYFARLWTS